MYVIHKPALLHKVLSLLDPRPGGVYLDGTVGAGGHSFEILSSSSPDGVVIGLDLDSKMLEISSERLSKFKDRVFLFCENFKNFERVLEKLRKNFLDGALLDLGVSYIQLKDKTRGFSFSQNGPLDMRFGRDGPTASEILNYLHYPELFKILREYGEEGAKRASNIAHLICEERKRRPLETTSDLVKIVLKAYSIKARELKRYRIHPATKTFQAIRITVNNELENLKSFLKKIPKYLRGRLVIISFHSLEDRIVKQTFLKWRREGLGEILTKKAIKPEREEVMRNPSSRSAKLRCFEFNKLGYKAP